jgi:hypothetical protein
MYCVEEFLSGHHKYGVCETVSFFFCAALRLELFARNRFKVANLNRRDAGGTMAPPSQQPFTQCASSDWPYFAVEDASFGGQAAFPKAQRHVSLHLKKIAVARS